jgi:hypothetical protein
MTELSKTSQRTKQIALTVVFTALYVVLRNIPYSMLIGGAGGFLWLSDFLVAIYGIVLGPYYGGLSVLIGNFVAAGFGHTMTFLGLDFLPDFLAVVSIGFLFRRKWLPVVLLNAALLIIFVVNPLTSVFVYSVPFVWLHLVAFVVLLSPLSRMAGKWIKEANPNRIVFSVAIFAFIAAMIQHLTGSILYEVELNQFFVAINQPPVIAASTYPGIWTAVFFAYPLERLFLIISAILVGTPIIWTLKKNSFLSFGEDEAHSNKATEHSKNEVGN